MKKIVVTLLVLACHLAESQNTYDLYNTCPGEYPAIDADGAFVSGYVAPGYEGEYQIFLHSTTPQVGHYWIDQFPGNAITYKIELVSFPFFLNCTNCVGSHISPPISATERKLYMPNTSFPYVASENAWVRDVTPFASAPPPGPQATYEYKLKREYTGLYGDVHGGSTNPAALATKGFVNGNNNELVIDYSQFYPHSVLKHTFYMHCGDEFAPIVDSFSFVLDHTRGRMRYYPFIGTNEYNNSNYVYDVPINPIIKFQGSNTGNYYYTSNDLNTIDYFPFSSNYDNICEDHVPEDISAIAIDYIRPAPFSLVQTFIGNGLANAAVGYELNTHAELPGIQHEYIIDRPLDLSIINPSEKIIYNPSEVSIDLSLTGPGQTLVFPSGYTFKTVSGIYPTEAQVLAADPDNMYLNDLDIPVPTTLSCDDVGPNEGIFSYYYVKNGSTLNIMPCVNIYDTKIIVETGATLNYDANSVRGNFIVQSAGGTIDNAHSFPEPVSCRFDCFDKQKYDDKAGDLHVTSSQIWTAGIGGIPNTFDVETDGVMRISGALIIEPNVTLEISGPVRFEFGENGKIVIEPKGKLLVNGYPSDPAIFTSADFCELGMWNGIEVRGDRAQRQGVLSTTPQGSVKMTYAKISNARNAFATRKEGNGWEFNGGIIQCRNVEFLNNRRSAEFLSYHNITPSGTELRNLSYFIDCKFLVTDYLNDKRYRHADGRRYGSVNQVSMWDVKNVKFENCIFENSAVQDDGVTALLHTDQRGAAIFAIDAEIRLAGGTLKNTFKGFSDGVWAISTGDNDFISIEGNVFENNVNGIVLEGTTLSRINQNTFLVPAHTYNPYALAPSYNSGYNKPVGLYLIGATDFTAEENTFTNYGLASTDGIPLNEYNYGMVVNNCTGDLGEGTGHVYKSTFSNMNVSLQAELNNRGGFSPGFSEAGLQYKCNEFTNRVSYDVVVPSTNVFPSQSSLIRHQGFCAPGEPQKQAGNTYYSSCTPPSDLQLKFDTDSESENAGFLYSDQGVKFECTTLFGADDECNALIGLNACPSNISTCSTPPCLVSASISSAAEAALSLAEYKLLLDGGNTADLIAQINSSMSPGALKNLLMSKSPYLSDAVLLAMLSRANPLPPGHIKEVTIANSPLTKPVMDVVESKGLPQGILNDILAAQVGVSARAEKENEVSYNEFQAKLAEVKVKQAYLEIDNLDSLKIVALKDTTLAGLFKLMEVLIAKGDLAQAQACRSLIISKEIPHISDRCRLLSTRLNLALAGKSWFDMSSAQADLVTQIYNNNPATAINARAVLALTKGLKYQRYPFDIDQSHKMQPLPEEKIIKAELSSMKVYPNPSAEQTSVEVNFPEDVQEVQLEVYDLLGARVFMQIIMNHETTVVETKNLNNGIYFFVIKAKDGRSEKQKVIISK